MTSLTPCPSSTLSIISEHEPAESESSSASLEDVKFQWDSSKSASHSNDVAADMDEGSRRASLYTAMLETTNEELEKAAGTPKLKSGQLMKHSLALTKSKSQVSMDSVDQIEWELSHLRLNLDLRRHSLDSRKRRCSEMGSLRSHMSNTASLLDKSKVADLKQQMDDVNQLCKTMVDQNMYLKSQLKHRMGECEAYQCQVEHLTMELAQTQDQVVAMQIAEQKVRHEFELKVGEMEQNVQVHRESIDQLLRRLMEYDADQKEMLIRELKSIGDWTCLSMQMSTVQNELFGLWRSLEHGSSLIKFEVEQIATRMNWLEDWKKLIYLRSCTRVHNMPQLIVNHVGLDGDTDQDAIGKQKLDQLRAQLEKMASKMDGQNKKKPTVAYPSTSRLLAIQHDLTKQLSLIGLKLNIISKE